ncbi:MAG TPA: hypothetical protein VGC06_30625 [Actinomycetes bacterium]
MTASDQSATTRPDGDAISFLLHQHREIRGLFQEVKRRRGATRDAIRDAGGRG